MNPNPQKSPNAQQEEKILEFWREQNIFQKTLEKKSEPGADQGTFTFFEGPPTANGKPGIHHVAARSFKDIIPRYKTMRGFRVHRKAGWDTHGLPVELQVEKQLGLKSKKEIEQFGVAEFNKKCRESVWEYKDEWEKITDRMGYWLDMRHPYATYENSYIEALWATVKRADERGHLYKDFKVLPWCTRCGTALSSHELNQPGAYKDVKDLSVYVKFKLESGQKIGDFEVGDNTYIVAWTTTPWTLPGNVALAVGADINYVIKKEGDINIIGAVDFIFLNSEEKEPEEIHKNILGNIKGADLVGLQYEPLYPFMQNLIKDQDEKMEKAYQVYAADFVTTTDGTGIVHTAVMYGADDFELGTKIGLPKFHTVNEEGKFIAGCDTETLKLSGRYVKETDEKGKPTLAVDIIDDLTARGLLFKKENYTHSYPHCWRCDTPLVYYARSSWYFRMSALRQQLLDANKNINWEPDHVRDGRFGEWLDGIKDWAISRDRYWGTPIPVWQTQDGAEKFVVGGLADLKKYAKKSGNKYFTVRHGQAQSNLADVWDFQGDPNNHLTELGKEQASESGKVLREKNIDIIITSPILRTQQTAQEIAVTLGIDTSAIIMDDRVIEWQVGSEFQGKSIKSFLEVRNAAENRYLFKTADGESYAELIKRVASFLYDLESKYQGKNILIVCHNSSGRGLDLAAKGFTFDALLKNEAKEFPMKNAEIRELDFVPLPHNENYELDFHKPYIDQIELVHPETGARLVRTAEVMDVWFDSGAMPYAQHHVLGEPMDFSPVPADYIAEGVDQTRGWFYTMHAIANMMNDTPTNNYNNVVCMGLLLDANGQKMSKSRGNVVSPWEVFDKYGADVVRFWFYSVNQPGEPKNFDEKSLDEVNKKVFNILRNVVSFYEMYQPAGDFPWVNPFESTNVLDQWILANLQKLSQGLVKNLDSYKVMESARAIREFINELSTWYVRRSRDRFKSDDETDKNFALATLQFVLDNLARYMAPFTPFLAEEIYQKVRIPKFQESVHLETWHTWNTESRFASTLAPMQTVRDLVTLGLEARANANIKVRQPLGKISISTCDLGNEYLEILKDELNVKEVVVDDNLEQGTVVLDTEITQDLKDEGDMRELSRAIQDMRKQADLVPSDRVIVSLTESEPAWFGGNLGKELLQTVGAESVVWGSGEAKVEKIG